MPCSQFGIFIHWGVYSVPSWAPVGVYAEWYWQHLVQETKDGKGPTLDFHTKTYGRDFKYAQFADRFTAELFNATSWMELIKASGAQ